MKTYTATVIKVGNSLALLLPKQYVEDANLIIGQKVQIELPIKLGKLDEILKDVRPSNIH